MINDLYNLLYWRDAWILSFTALPLLFILFNRVRQRWQWQKLADEHLQPWLEAKNPSSKSPRSFFLLALAWLCFVIALAGPRLVDWLPPEQQAKPASLIIVLDMSASMNAEDAYPNRKTQAIQWLKQSIKSKPEHLKMGIVIFAGHAFNLMPPTLDKKVIKHFINLLNDLPLPTLGNNLSAALILAKQQFINSDSEQHIAVLSDGDLSQKEQERTLKSIESHLKNQSISMIGFGGNNAVKIPKQSGGFVLLNGRPVQSRLQTTWLKHLNTLNNISYQHYETIKQLTLKQTIKLSSPRLDQQAQQYVLWQELFPYPLLLAIFLFIISLWRINPKLPSQIILSGCLISALLSHSPESHANEESILQKANAALNEESFLQAHDLFKQIDSATASFGAGIACYRQANFKCATSAFSKAAWQAKTNKLRANAVFNLGNSYFFLGEYDQASVLFKDAQNLGFNAEVAQRNLEFSNIMQQAVEQRVKDIKEIFRRAKWRAAVSGNPPPTLNNIISSQNNLSITKEDKPQNFLIRKAIVQQVNKQFGIQKGNSNTVNQWIKTEHVANQSTAQLLKRLLEMELSIPASLKEPQTIEGKRRW